MTDASRRPRLGLLDRPWTRSALTLAAFAAIIGGFVLLMNIFPPRPDPATRKLCDRAVAALLHSKEPIEVQRAGIIIHELNCSISRRLTDDDK